MFSNVVYKSRCFNTPVSSFVLKEAINEDGLVIVSRVTAEASVLPCYPEYALQSLLDSGVTLNRVSASVLDPTPMSDDKAQGVLDKLKVDNNDVIDNE